MQNCGKNNLLNEKKLFWSVAKQLVEIFII